MLSNRGPLGRTHPVFVFAVGEVRFGSTGVFSLLQEDIFRQAPSFIQENPFIFDFTKSNLTQRSVIRVRSIALSLLVRAMLIRRIS